MRKFWMVPVLAGAAFNLAGSQYAKASGISGDPVVAQWENPTFIGSLLDGATGSVYPPGVVNTSGTAIYDLGSKTPASSTTITWGDCPTGCQPGVSPDSSVTFTGNPQIPATLGTTPFSIGSISYTNGTSDNGTEIFGATLVLYAKGLGGNIPLGSTNFFFTATVNDGTANQNADYLNVQGVPGSFNVLEGFTATGALYGEIVGDPAFIPQYFSLDPNQDGIAFLGDNLPAPTPLPSTWTTLLLGFAGLGFFAYRGSKKNAGALTA